jgi:hypothetical protein
VASRLADDLVRKLTAILQDGEIPTSEADEEQLNAMVFEQHRLRPFADVHAESERVYTELITLVQQLDSTCSRVIVSSAGYPLSLAMCHAMRHTLLASLRDPSTTDDLANAVILTGAGERAFLAGAGMRASACCIHNGQCLELFYGHIPPRGMRSQSG